MQRTASLEDACKLLVKSCHSLEDSAAILLLLDTELFLHKPIAFIRCSTI